MGTLTLTELQEEVRSHLGDRDDFADRITRFLNFSQIRLARAYAFPELHKHSTAVGSYSGTSITDRFLTLPSNIRAVRSLVLEDGTTSRKMTYRAPRQFDREFAGYLDRGRRKPVIYTKWQEIVELMPVPDAQYNYDLRWIAWPTPFSTDTPTQTSDLDRKDELLILLSASIANHSLARPDRGRALYGMFATLLEQVTKDEQTEPDEDIKPLFESAGGPEKYWADPFSKSSP